MTNAELQRRMQSLADAKLARRAEIDDGARPPVTAAERLGAPFAVGDRVLDLRSGQDGEVIDVGPPDRSGTVLVTVAYSDGRRGLRDVADLLARPRPPAARP